MEDEGDLRGDNGEDGDATGLVEIRPCEGDRERGGGGGLGFFKRCGAVLRAGTPPSSSAPAPAPAPAPALAPALAPTITAATAALFSPPLVAPPLPQLPPLRSMSEIKGVRPIGRSLLMTPSSPPSPPPSPPTSPPTSRPMSRPMSLSAKGSMGSDSGASSTASSSPKNDLPD